MGGSDSPGLGGVTELVVFQFCSIIHSPIYSFNKHTVCTSICLMLGHKLSHRHSACSQGHTVQVDTLNGPITH